MIDTLLRQWTLLQLIPRHPRRIDPARLKARLDGMGLAVTRDSRSVGANTTSTVVQSLVAIIILNAIFAVAFVQLNI